MELTFAQALKEKQNDVRLVERDRSVGRLNEKEFLKVGAALEDSSALATYVNIDDIMANDNPIHVGRNLPQLDGRKPQPFEELEFEEQASKLQFEH
jgi:hypothetical protein